MNILFISLYNPQETDSGNQRVTLVMAKELTRQGINCYLAYLKNTVEKTDAIFVDSYQMNYKKILEFRMFLQNNSIDVIHNQAYRIVDMSYLKNAKHSLPIKIVTVFHTMPGSELIRRSYSSLLLHVRYKQDLFLKVVYFCAFLFSPILSLLVKRRLRQKYRDLCNNSDWIIFLSKSYIDSFKKLAELKSYSNCCFYSIPNSLSYELKLVNIEHKVKEFLIVARFDEISKRILLALKIWKSFCDKFNQNGEWKLRIVGYGGWEKEYKTFVVKNKLHNVIFEGKQDPYLYYKKASFLLFTSAIEGFSLSLVEAMQMRCIPIAFKSYFAIQDVIENDYNGVLLEDNDINGYVNAMGDLIYNSNKCHTLSMNGMEYCKSISIDNVIGKWIDLYHNLLKD